MNMIDYDKMIMELIREFAEKHGQEIRGLEELAKDFENETDLKKKISIYLDKILPADIRAIVLSDRINLLQLIKPIHSQKTREQVVELILQSSIISKGVTRNLKSMTNIIKKELDKDD